MSTSASALLEKPRDPDAGWFDLEPDLPYALPPRLPPAVREWALTVPRGPARTPAPGRHIPIR